MENAHRTALVTGANAGLGLEAAGQLAEAGWGKVILACRTLDKAEAARTQLIERTGRDPFSTLAIDTSEIASANAAADELERRGERLHFLLLNAGASGKEPTRNSDGVEITYASLIGHHVLTVRALKDGLLAEGARIVIAGSEGARGNMPGMKVHNVEQIAKESFGNDPAAAIEALFRLEVPAQRRFTNMNEYVTSKLIVAWWAAALAWRLPEGITVNAVSPGSTPGTGFARNAPAALRYLMLPAMKIVGPLMGMAGSIEQAARRYLDAADYADHETGHFYATAHRKKLVGPVGIQTWPAYLSDERLQEAALAAVVKAAATPMPPLGGNEGVGSVDGGPGASAPPATPTTGVSR